jgi:methylenetetrahydrofolate dehydrogenase (NADP+)/methenyltetrahydrofolate cyclohydrolase
VIEKIIDGKKVSNEIKENIKLETEKFVNQGSRKPGLALMIVGNNPASESYVTSKDKACKTLGFNSLILRLPSDVTENAVMDYIHNWNNDDSIDGILIQLPLPKQINENRVIEEINPEKDVDGFHPTSVGKLVIGLDCFVSCTPAGIIELIKAYKVETSGKHVVVVGRSNIVGKPILNLFYQKNIANSTVTIVHTGTKDMTEFTKQADILVVAIGVPNFIKAKDIKAGCVIIDVGINRVDANNEKGYKICGDVDFEDVLEKVSLITPVPGGVGPMTIAMLLSNTFKSYKKRLKLI